MAEIFNFSTFGKNKQITRFRSLDNFKIEVTGPKKVQPLDYVLINLPKTMIFRSCEFVLIRSLLMINGGYIQLFIFGQNLPRRCSQGSPGGWSKFFTKMVD